MCRYSDYRYREHAVCFACRFHCQPAHYGEVDNANLQALNEGFVPLKKVNCPNCHSQPLSYVGRDFRAPSKHDDQAWEVIKMLYDAGIRYDSCGCSGPGWRPTTVSEAKRYINLSKGQRWEAERRYSTRKR